jgi:hypothetical protein
MEFSLGINDKNAFSRAKTKKNLLSCLQKYLKAKPKADVFLVVPVTHQSGFQKEWPKLYSEIALELKLPLINKERVMHKAFYDKDNRFYYDNTHPNYFGALRLIEYILHSISGPVAKNKLRWNKNFFTGSKKALLGINLAAGKKIIEKSWYWPHNKSSALKGGDPQYHPILRRLEPISVNENALIEISGVNLFRISMMDEKGRLVYTFAPSNWKDHGISYIYVPYGIKELRISLEPSQADKKNKSPILEYMRSGALSELNQKKIYYQRGDL